MDIKYSPEQAAGRLCKALTPKEESQKDKSFLSVRAWFSKLVDLEEVYPYLEKLRERLNATFLNEVSYPFTLENFSSTVLSDLKPFSKVINSSLVLKNKATKKYFYHQFSPLYKTIGCWLTGVTNIAHVWTPAGSELLKLHAEMLSSADYKINILQDYELASRHADIIFSEVFTNSFIDNSEIEDFSFVLPVFLLGIAQFPSSLYEETLGANLAMCQFIDFLNTTHPDEEPLLGRKTKTHFTDLAIKALHEHHLTDELANFKKIIIGYNTTYLLIDDFINQLEERLKQRNRFTNNNSMLSLIARVGPYGFGYHKRGEIDNKPIDYWLEPENFCPTKILAKLATSRYIRPGKPDRSVFIKLITQPNGGMFGIFTPSDVLIIKKWIEEMPQNNDFQSSHFDSLRKEKDIKCNYDKTLNLKEVNNYFSKSINKYANYSLRQFYPLFLQVDRNPDVIPAAKKFVEKWLLSHQRATEREGFPFTEYSHEKINKWFNIQHRRQVESYIPLVGNPDESKEEVINGAVGLAPLTMIDGAWLRNVNQSARVNTYIGAFQYQTLLDELGMGDNELHHGNIYKKLLASMNIDVGNFTDKTFADSECFEDDDFKVPVFWLAISLFPNSYLPETLGLNLAMELSGVGGEYRRSGDVLRHYGFSSLFVDLHNTVDNVVTGHSAWAIEAIRHHLDDVFQRGGAEARERNWKRVWVGYQALNPPKNKWIDIIGGFFKSKFQTSLK